MQTDFQPPLQGRLFSPLAYTKTYAMAVAAGLAVTPFASGLAHPRWLYVLPNGDVLVAETNAPPKPSPRTMIPP